MTDKFRLLMLGAMYENGGNTTHRFLNGHPQLVDADKILNDLPEAQMALAASKSSK